MSESTAETYREAAQEALERAFWLHSNEKYFLAHYVAGLAVECHLRAYLRSHTDEFKARHDLRLLAEESNFYNIVPQGLEGKFSNDFETLNLRWRSNHRYYSERQFLDHMNVIKAEYDKKGDRWKNLSRTLYNLADNIIRQGEAKWKTK